MTTTLTAPPTSTTGATQYIPLVPVLPESAPFSTAQRAWLNGFLAGMLGGQTALAVQSLTPGAAPAPPAQEEEQFPWHDPAMTIDDRMKLAEDKPHERKLMAAMAQLDCGACGYVCQTYSEAIARGEEKDLTRCTPGGRDTVKTLKQLVAAAPKKVVPVADVKVRKSAQAPAPPDGSAGWDRNTPFPARLIRSKPLNSAASSKDTRLVEIDLRNSGITYKPGDALGVFPENCPDLVSEVLDALGLTGAEDVPGWDGLPMSLREALSREFTITRPTPDLLDILSRCATDDGQRAALQALRDNEDGAGDLQIVDLLHKFPSARPAAGDFVATLSPLAPRLYSISSSLRAHPGQVHLTVGAVRYANAVGRKCKGVASTFLGGGIRPGQTVRVFVHPSHKFGLPSTDAPVIMVGPGTGVAPFRAFLQERAVAGSKGKNWLFFGDQREECDFLFREELGRYLTDGVLSRLDTAFSRDGDQKIYVQNRMLENAGDIWRWLQEGGHFYVCGDAKRMASDVDKALRRIIAEQGGLSPAQVDQYVSDLVRNGRYQRDVY
ncbi:MAG TPA: sulfite reductase subunit alpha [Tepidisphaeraceae bacterium]|jgi:sulfite reductase (NADPH) flavoprotein alpha-component|nr:sulfite reductase subunit alpha [Tepidisphaeraceae bacterium]